MKKRPASHIIDAMGTELLMNALPTQWVVRPYQPDYGIDFAVEIFDEIDKNLVTLGEHFFIQLKSCTKANYISRKVHHRYNVEKYPFEADTDVSRELKLVSISIERDELELARAMGPAVPLLLIVADLDSSELYWICLNDLVDKVLVPENPNFSMQSSHTVHIPMFNKVKNQKSELLPLQFYARRAKLYAAFNRFRYQRHEIERAANELSKADFLSIENIRNSEFICFSKHFLDIALAYDFWNTTYAWPAIELAKAELDRTLNLIQAIIRGDEVKTILTEQYHDQERLFYLQEPMIVFFLMEQISSTFNKLANLGNIYEEICREWFLPTFFAALAEEHCL
ncbi:DUF4365 domain-containing protein [Shewanella oncorhynchi]|uniref:DUF4365 domain-containing protein n=1 Tax=Shewanella oncorhynchi TaxID=2726434 RepID=UPI0039EEE38F